MWIHKLALFRPIIHNTSTLIVGLKNLNASNINLRTHTLKSSGQREEIFHVGFAETCSRCLKLREYKEIEMSFMKCTIIYYRTYLGNH